MKLIIDIPEEIYNNACAANNTWNMRMAGFVCSAIANGTPLPKGHGRILDEKDILDTENNDGGWYDLVDMLEYIAGVKAIIEADKAESDGKCKNCEYYRNPDYTRCHECEAERSE